MKKKAITQKISTLALFGLLVFYAFISIYPLFYLFFYSFKTNDEIFFTNPFGITLNPQFINYVHAVQAFDLPAYFRSSIFVTGMSVLVIIVFSLPFSYSMARMKWGFKKPLSVYLSLGLFIPIQVIIIPLAILVKNLHFSNTHFALIIPYAAFNLAFTCMILTNSFATLPKELEESAFIDGAGIYRCFFRIMIPMVKPAVATSMIFAMLNVWNEYLLASILISDNKIKTLPVGLAAFVGSRSTDWGAMGACMVIASLPTIVLYLLFSEQIEDALTVSGAVKG
jgi:raffinose/stachyose/melibiose transport system permease protein